MYFIYSIIVFVLCSFFARFIPNSEVSEVFTIIFAFISFVFFLVAIFYNLNIPGKMSRYVECIRSNFQLLEDIKVLHEETMETTVKYLGKEYPDFEKEIFEKMSSSEKDAISAFFVKYPELSTARGFEKIVHASENHASRILSIKNDIRRDMTEINIVLADKWVFLHYNLPADIVNLIYEKR